MFDWVLPGIKEHVKKTSTSNIYIPGDPSSWMSSSSSLLTPPSVGSLSGAPYHFLSFGPPTESSNATVNRRTLTKNLSLYHFFTFDVV